jgi:hypothetical protein
MATQRNGATPTLSLRTPVSLRSARWMMRRSRLFIGLKWNGIRVFFTFSAAVSALRRSSSMRSAR